MMGRHLKPFSMNFANLLLFAWAGARRLPVLAVILLATASPPVAAAAPGCTAPPVDPTRVSRERPLVIAPQVEHVYLCDEAAENPRIGSMHEAMLWCLDHRRDAASRIARKLDEFEPGGPRGDIRMGYLAPLPLLDLFVRKGQEWVIDERKVDLYLNLIRKVKRPVVVYLAANQFVSLGDLPKALAGDPRNLMQLPDGRAPTISYFGFSIYPWTLLPDESIPVNRYRFLALRHVAKRLQALPREARDRIVAITLAGELHHMYPDFEAGTGAFAPALVTDYSPASVAAFRRWLQSRHGTIAALNRLLGTAYRDVEQVPAPGKDLRSVPQAPRAEHYDGFAGGSVPVTGWLWDPQCRVRSLELHVDGRPAGAIETGLNRQDVYRALDEVTTPNVGFRTDLDYRRLAPGEHLLQVVASDGRDQRYLLGESRITVVAPGQAGPTAVPRGTMGLRPVSDLGVRSYLDLPKDRQTLLHNRLAAEWDRFRSEQVRDFLQAFWTAARAAGLPESKLYSHQILAGANPTWNGNLFAGDATVGAGLPWRPGFNLYGGATDNEWLRKRLQEWQAADYGVPEFNPQQWKTPGAHRRALLAQYRQGARFVSPYMVSTIPDRFKPPQKNLLLGMEIRPDNPAEGSDQFYRAIVDLVREH
jgi:hypothetical protein